MAERKRTGRRRAFLAAGILLALGWLATGAAIVDTIDGRAVITQPTGFELQVAGTEGASLDPDVPWVDGDPVPGEVELVGGAGFGPGSQRTFTLGVKNASDQLTGSVRMTVFNPEPQPGLTLFDAMEFTVTHDGAVLADSVPGAELERLADLPLGDIAAGGSTTVLVDISLPGSLGNEYQGLASRVMISMKGMNR
ncbi:hypothetical protein ACFVWR_09415 [Leifsonia sp. NPDC058292]|uniref:hypothetical protein n=1 Tax=Leifsonia sp. NPDC058292 TaxID=3346428 RepID=UPI0036DBC452